MVVKVPAYNPWIPFDYSAWDSTWTEAVVNDALSPHGRIVDMYSFCGLSILSQAMEKGDLYSVAAPRYERCQKDLPRNAWELRNDLTGRQKVEFALEMAQAVAVLHNHAGGAIVHNDVQVSQFLMSSDNKIKLTDFNRATVKQWSTKDPNHPCVYSYFKTPGSVSRRRRRRCFVCEGVAQTCRMHYAHSIGCDSLRKNTSWEVLWMKRLTFITLPPAL